MLLRVCNTYRRSSVVGPVFLSLLLLLLRPGLAAEPDR